MLITDSVERAEQGAQQAEVAGNTMDEVVTAIQPVADVVGEISSASFEQARGVSRVSEAISPIGQVTQQNAALVQESAAAAESLRDQASLVVQSVAVFQVS